MREEEFVTVKEKKCSFIGCLFRLVTFAVAVYGAYTAVKKVLTRLSRRLEEDNEGSERKRYLVGLGSRKICLEDESVADVDLTVVGGSAELDLSDAELGTDTFVKVRTLGGKVVIKVPAMVQVRLDGKGVLCGLSDMVPGYEDESLPVIYVNAECAAACLKVRIGDE